MYDYMRALQVRFDHQTHGELEELTESARIELHQELDAAGRRKLLRLTDAQNALLE